MSLERDILAIIHDPTLYEVGWDGVTGESFPYKDQRARKILEMLAARRQDLAASVDAILEDVAHEAVDIDSAIHDDPDRTRHVAAILPYVKRRTRVYTFETMADREGRFPSGTNVQVVALAGEVPAAVTDFISTVAGVEREIDYYATCPMIVIVASVFDREQGEHQTVITDVIDRREGH